MILALAAGPAFGAASDDKPKRRLVPPPPPPTAVDAGLRGPLSAPVTPASPLKVPNLGLAAPGVALAGLSTAGFSTPPPITPLPQVGDPAPICRAECAKARIVCASSDDLGCDSRWVQCAADCSAPNFR